jgi:hypothetical protein
MSARRRRSDDPFETFQASFPKLHAVPDPVAAEVWTFKNEKGRTLHTRIEVGKPQPVPGDRRGTWFCPVYIDSWMSQLRPSFGEGPLGALMNALKLVQGFREHVADIHIHAEYGTDDRPRSHRRRGRDRKTKGRS